MRKYIKPEFEEKIVMSEAVLGTAPVSELYNKYGMQSLNGITSYQFTSNHTFESNDVEIALGNENIIAD